MERHCENAMELAEWLDKHPKIARVIYPGLKSSSTCASKRTNALFWRHDFSRIKMDDREKTISMLEHCHIFALAESLGGVESLIEHPAIMTHASLPKKEREALGIKDNFIRLSVGIEAIDDLKNDLDNALHI